MGLDHGQIEELKGCYPNLKLLEEGGVEFVFISPLPLPPGCTPGSVDGLLCPSLRDSYTSRLFLSARVAHGGQGQNWNANGVVIGGRKWWAVSWRTNQDKLTLLGMVIAHLQAFK
jgi:hypothetical protein